jgi:hypothetical protein
MIITIGEYNCGGSGYCHQWDYDLENYVMTPAGDTLEIGRFITPYATEGTPGFSSTWQQHYIFDVSDYYNILKDSATMVINYSGYSYGFNGDVKFAFIEGTPERNVLGYDRLWNNTYSYGDPSNPIDSNILPYTLTPPAGTISPEMKFLITGHGYDNATGCCEFDVTGVGHTYSVWVNNYLLAQHNMNVNCGMSELYPQGGTWLYQRAGNWCPGGSVNLAKYPLTGVIAGGPYTTKVSFDDRYNGGGNYGIYKIASSVFYYGYPNKSLDASLEDIIAPTSFEWYRRENPRVSAPVIKIRNSGGTAITSILLQYGVQDSAMAQYIWTGFLVPLHDTIITLPAIAALTNLSLNAIGGTHGFVAQILQVNGQSDEDPSNDTLTSQFTIAPKWPNTFIMRLSTSSIGADGNFGDNPADASWIITDENGNTVSSRTNTDVTTTYNDTVRLKSEGFYTLSVSTSQCYGLQWWALQGQAGYTAGALAVVNYTYSPYAYLNLNGTQNTGQYQDDFGCGFIQYFTTAGQCQAVTPFISASGNLLSSSIAAAYQWYKNGVAIDSATSQTYAAGPLTGNYTVTTIDGNGCMATSASYAFVPTAISDLSAFASSVAVYPNPASESFNLSVSAELMGANYTLRDMTGRKMLAGKVISDLTSISLSGFARGIYLLSIDDGAGSITKRIAVQR